jgi:hypothetical protein
MLHFGPGEPRPTPEQMRSIVTQRRAERKRSPEPGRANQRLVLRLYGEQDNPGIQGGLVNPLRLDMPGSNRDERGLEPEVLMTPTLPERHHYRPVPNPMMERPGPDTKNPTLQRQVSLLNDRSEQRDHPTRLPDVLKRLADVTGMNVLADSYQTDRGDYLDWQKPLVNVPLWRVIRQIEYDFCMKCEVKDGWLLFRHRRWPFEEERQLPEELLASLDREVRQQHGMKDDRLEQVAVQLSEPQFKNLRKLYPELANERLPYHSLRLKAGLSVRQKQMAAGDGVPLSILTPAQKAEVRAVLAAARPYIPYADPGQAADLRVTVRRSPDGTGPMVRYRFAAGDTVEAGWRDFYPISGRAPEDLPARRPRVDAVMDL